MLILKLQSLTQSSTLGPSEGSGERWGCLSIPSPPCLPYFPGTGLRGKDRDKQLSTGSLSSVDHSCGSIWKKGGQLMPRSPTPLLTAAVAAILDLNESFLNLQRFGSSTSAPEWLLLHLSPFPCFTASASKLKCYLTHFQFPASPQLPPQPCPRRTCHLVRPITQKCSKAQRGPCLLYSAKFSPFLH